MSNSQSSPPTKRTIPLTNRSYFLFSIRHFCFFSILPSLPPNPFVLISTFFPCSSSDFTASSSSTTIFGTSRLILRNRATMESETMSLIGSDKKSKVSRNKMTQSVLEILAKAQMRLEKLDELRQAAKTSVEIRSERERVKLGTQVESRVQKTEAYRMKILKASHQKRACAKERMSQSMMRRMARENKYKERVRASINQKHVAAEKNRLRLLEAEKKKANARVQQIRHVANSVSNQREMEITKMRDKLEHKLERVICDC